MTANEVQRRRCLLFENVRQGLAPLPCRFQPAAAELLETENEPPAGGRQRGTGTWRRCSVRWRSKSPTMNGCCGGRAAYGLAESSSHDDGGQGKVGVLPAALFNAVNSFAQLIPEQVVDVY